MIGSRKVSIVIPCFNQGEWLLEAIESIKVSHCSSILEIIIVNDGSDQPNTLEVLRSLNPAEFVLVHQDNRGLAAARNRGIEIAVGEFVLPLDADNAVNSAYFTSGVSRLSEDSGLGVVYGNAKYFGERSGDWIVRDFSLKDLVRGNYIDACALFRKSAWYSVGGYDEGMPFMGWEDWDFWLRLANKGWRFKHLNEFAFKYRVRANSMISTTNKHSKELQDYIFSKNEFIGFKLSREILQGFTDKQSVQESKRISVKRLIKKILRYIS